MESVEQVCGRCRRSFPDPETLERHLSVHDDERVVVPDPKTPRVSLDLSTSYVLPVGSRFCPARCVGCGYTWIQPVCDAVPLQGPDPMRCPECHHNRLEERVPTKDEATWIEKAGPGFLSRYLSNVRQIQFSQRRKRFGSAGPIAPPFGPKLTDEEKDFAESAAWLTRMKYGGRSR